MTVRGRSFAGHGTLGRADLVRALDLADASRDPSRDVSIDATGDAFGDAARLLGFEARPAPPEHRKPVPAGAPRGEREARDVPDVEPEYVPEELPFHVVYGFAPREIPAPRPPEPIYGASDSTPRAARPPATPPLLAWPRLWTWLRRALSRTRDKSEIDVLALVDRWSRGELIRRIPRRKDRGLAPRVWILADRDPRLTPFYDDQDDLRARLARLLGDRALVEWSYLAGPESAPLGRGAVGAPLGRGAEGGAPRPPPPHVPVLLLGDLGAYAGPIVQAAWRRRGEELARRGHRLHALIPAPTPRWPGFARDLWNAQVWDRSDGDDISFDERELRALRLLRLLAPAVRVEPGLLRSVRLRLTVHEADASTEVDAWQHDAVGGSSAVALSLDRDWQELARVERKSEALAQRRAVADLMREWHAAAPREIEHEEAMSLFACDPDVASPEHVRAALEFLNRVAARDAPQLSGLGDWSRRVGVRVPAALKTHDEFGPVFVRLFEKYERSIDDTAEPPPGWRPTPPERAAPRAWRLEQRGGTITPRLVVPRAGLEEEQDSALAIVTAAGAELVLHDAGAPSQRLAIDAARALALPKLDDRGVESTTPSWAVASGADEFGIWADCEIRGVRMRMRWIEPGTFLMGSPEDEAERWDDETQHEVTLTRGYWIADTAVTQELWQVVMDKNPSRFKGPQRPVDSVSWDDAQRLVQTVNCEIPDLELRLPTEAEWEFACRACRAGTTTPFSFGANVTPDDVNYDGNFPYANGPKGRYREHTVGVGSLPPNAWGLFEMHGNVWEWCQDWFGEYGPGRAVDPTGPSRGSERVLRGGSWFASAWFCRSAYRSASAPGDRISSIGFRLARGQGQSGPGREPDPATGPDGARRREGRASAVAESAPVAEIRVARRFTIATDQGDWHAGTITKPEWARAIGRDRFGLWVEIEVNDVSFRMRWIPPGRFWMGSPEGEVGRYDWEHHREEIVPSGFWLGETPCTQELWQAVMGKNPSRFRSATRPVEQVTWDDTKAFFEKVAKASGLRCHLPAERDWEYACRAGTTTSTYAGELEIRGDNDDPVLDDIAWYGGNSGVDFELEDGEDSRGWPKKQYDHKRAGTHPVARKAPNGFGLYDMIGNVWEWCVDRVDWTGREIVRNPTEGSRRVLRGGSWNDLARICRSASRLANAPGARNSSIGFRLARGQGAGQESSQEREQDGARRREGRASAAAESRRAPEAPAKPSSRRRKRRK